MSTSKMGYSLTSSLYHYCMCLFVLFGFLGCSVSAFALPRTDDDLIEMECGEEYSTYLLVTYDTIHGSTAEVAEYIGNDLCDQGFRVDLRLVTNVEDIGKYDAIIVGSAIYQFTWLRDAKNFLKRNQTALAQLPIAYFIVGASMSVDTPETREEVKKAFVDPVLEKFPEITPLSIGLFGGAVDFDTNDYNLFEWVVLKILGFILGYTEGADWRNWDAIDTWSKELAEEL